MKQETLTPKEAALYLGQDVLYPDVDDTAIVATLTGVTHDEIETTYKTRKRGEPSGDWLSFKSNGNHNSDALNAKLLLRPLADITEEELKEIGFKSVGKLSARFQFEHVQRTAKSDNVPLAFAPVAFQYLLSKGFDLFGFIESGKALDKTKIN